MYSGDQETARSCSRLQGRLIESGKRRVLSRDSDIVLAVGRNGPSRRWSLLAALTRLRAVLTKPDRNGNGERISLKQAARAASREAEKGLILSVLTRTRWNRRRAAQELQISYKALLYKLKHIGYGEFGSS